MAWFTLVDHGMTPVSDRREIVEWLQRLRERVAKSPDDAGLAIALKGVERLARDAGITLETAQDARHEEREEMARPSA